MRLNARWRMESAADAAQEQWTPVLGPTMPLGEGVDVKNIYRISGCVTWRREIECECCGQPYEKEEEGKIEIQIEATDEQAAATAALAQVERDLRNQYRGDGITFAAWGVVDNWRKPLVEKVREISEAELMARAGAARLF